MRLGGDGFLPKLGSLLLLLLGVVRSSALVIVHEEQRDIPHGNVTFDDKSLFVNGERVLFYSGEFHPFRLPVPGLWLDVFQKIRALGYNAVSAYWDWALMEGNPGHFTADGVFALEPFFEAAQQAGIYILARPGPYINAEASGGGFPGWLSRLDAKLRHTGPYIEATNNYVNSICGIISKAEINNGGPVILVQVENEYNYDEAKGDPSPGYFEQVIKQFRNAGITVPLISNNAGPYGNNAPGTPEPVDIYGHDSYPIGFGCDTPYQWNGSQLPTNFRELHEQQSPTTPYSIIENQGGSFDPWGGAGFEMCTALVGPEFERVYYKNDFSFGVTIFNIYMTYGGTNWGNLGHPFGYTSYDYGAAIKETREVTRQKYSEAKLMANFLMASPGYLEAIPGDRYNSTSNSQITITPLKTKGVRPYDQQFLVVRRLDVASTDDATYTLDIDTTKGKLTVPQLGGNLTLHGRDSKVHVVDYPVGKFHMLYSTAEIFTWKKDRSGKTVLVVYGGEDETHEIAFVNLPRGSPFFDEKLNTKNVQSTLIINWHTQPTAQVAELPGGLIVYLVDRNTAYDHWVLNIPSTSPKPTEDALIVKGGYLLRNATVEGSTVALTGDLNSTTSLQILAGVPSNTKKLTLNGKNIAFTQNRQGVVTSDSIEYAAPKISLPDLSAQKWYYADTLPELQPGYSDKAWKSADLTYTNNTFRSLTTPTSLYSQDYGYHTGTLLYRGHFHANGNESKVAITAQGGNAFSFSVWLGSNFLGSYVGDPDVDYKNQTFTLPSNLTKGNEYVLNVVIDTLGLEEDLNPPDDVMKTPRGIPDFELFGHPQSDVHWKLTGNLGGEQYIDQARGPRNEGGLWAERQGYHLPNPPVSGWKQVSDLSLSQPGVGFYATSFKLDMPQGYDVPLSLRLPDIKSSGTSYRVQLFVNGWQFGKYISDIGPQTSFPVPQGILDYYGGENSLAVSLWALDAKGAKLDGLSLEAGQPVEWAYDVDMVSSPGWKKRQGAY